MLLRCTLGALIAATTFAHADITRLDCIQTGADQYKLSYALTGNTRSVEIFASTDPQHPAASPLLTTHDSTVTLKAGKPGERMYFFLKADSGEQREVSIRHLALEGTPNFRDLGGYETTDGHFVRWGVLYRAGVLTALTPADFQYLAQMNIHVICDFRTQGETTASPEVWIPNAQVIHLSLPIGTDDKNKDVNSQMAAILKANPTPDQLRGWMAKSYANFAFGAAPQFASLFDELKKDPEPMLYHCAGGKDRTGVFSAFVLLTLGVPESTVLNDYALTNRYLAEASPEAMRRMSAGSGAAGLSKLSPEQQKVLMAADPAYLEGTLRAIDQKYGSFDNYRRQELHVSNADQAMLRSRLLQ